MCSLRVSGSDYVRSMESSSAGVSLRESAGISSASDVAYDEFKQDLEHINNNKNEVIAGFLSVGNKDGWNAEEGNTYELGLRVTRYMLRKFWQKKSAALSEYKDIIEPSLKSYSVSLAKNASGNQPRAMLDANTRGWDKHGVTRFVGNVSLKYRENGPFFEVIINSARTRKDETNCYPFTVNILSNFQIAEDRAKLLNNMRNLSEKYGYPAYHKSVLSTRQFIENYKQEHKSNPPGPNSSHLLEGLQFLETVKLKCQTLGNCWLKQPKRSVLLSFYLQTLTYRPELTSQQAWKLSKKLYSKWKDFVSDELKEMCLSNGVTLDLTSIALDKLNSRKK